MELARLQQLEALLIEFGDDGEKALCRLAEQGDKDSNFFQALSDALLMSASLSAFVTVVTEQISNPK